MRTFLSIILLCWSSLAASTAYIGTLVVGEGSYGGEGGGDDDEWVVDNFGSGDNAFSIEFVTIGDPGNASDVNYLGVTCGDVNYSFRISKYEISEHQFWGAIRSGGLIATPSNLGTNKPVTLLSQYEMAKYVNWLNEEAGYHIAYQFDENDEPQAWGLDDAWDLGGQTNIFRHKDCLYFLPSYDEYYKAAFYDPSTETWYNYANGSDTPPTPIEGFFTNGGTNDNTAVYNQRMFPWYPEHDSTGNVVNVTLTTSGGAVTGIAFDSYVSGHVFQETNSDVDADTIYKIVQGAVTNATAKVASWQTITNVPGTFTNYVGGAGYTDGAATVALSGDTVNITLYTSGGAVMGAIPVGGAFASRDYTTDLDIVQAGGSNATCRVSRYSDVTYNGPKVPASWTIISGGSGYSDGAGTFQTHGTSWYPDLDPLVGISFYTLCQGAADVDRVGSPSPYGVYGLGGNVSDSMDSQLNVDGGRYVNADIDGCIKYGGGWWFRLAAVLQHGGNDCWSAWQPDQTGGAYGNGLRVARKLLDGE